jgi:predicted DsbA family dithiol-disulfide isomerase
MAVPIKIDFVSDVSCPWCIIGLNGLEEAIRRIGDEIDATIIFQPFELNPAMPAGGQEIGEHIAEKYGSTPEQMAANRAMIRARAAEVGFTMTMAEGSRIYNTFDAHRLLHWAEEANVEGGGHQAVLKHRLFEAYFTDGKDPSDHAVLVEAAVAAGLDGVAARAVLESGRYADEVRAAEKLWQSRGIGSVPAIVINDRYLISGGQPVAAFEQALRGIAAEGVAA